MLCKILKLSKYIPCISHTPSLKLGIKVDIKRRTHNFMISSQRAVRKESLLNFIIPVFQATSHTIDI